MLKLGAGHLRLDHSTCWHMQVPGLGAGLVELWGLPCWAAASIGKHESHDLGQASLGVDKAGCRLSHLLVCMRTSAGTGSELCQAGLQYPLARARSEAGNMPSRETVSIPLLGVPVAGEHKNQGLE